MGPFSRARKSNQLVSLYSAEPFVEELGISGGPGFEGDSVGVVRGDCGACGEGEGEDEGGVVAERVNNGDEAQEDAEEEEMVADS